MLTCCPGVQSLGADEAVDYTAADLGKQFADAPFDVIIDPVGGETEEKSYGILAPNGRYSHIYNRDTNQERSKQMQSEWTDGRKYVMTICKPDANQLRQVCWSLVFTISSAHRTHPDVLSFA